MSDGVRSVDTKAFCIDRAVSSSINVDFTVDDVDADEFDWSTVDVVQVSDVPHSHAFDTDTFYKIPLTAARSVEQSYTRSDGEEVTMVKPPSELRSAAWSLDNAPLTLGHPPSRIVDGVERVHGFTRDASWNADVESVTANAYIPVTDTEAQNWITDGRDGVSIGFWYNRDASIDESVFGDGVDAVQRDLLVDHVAIVAEGRCSREDGCGLAADAATAVRGFTADTGVDGCSDGACSCGLHVSDSDCTTDSDSDGASIVAGDRVSASSNETPYASVSVSHQVASDGMTVDMASCPVDFYVAVHDEGSDVTRQNVSVGEQLGRSGVYDGGSDVTGITVPFDDTVREPRRVYAVLYISDVDGDMLTPYEAKNGFVFDSCVVMPRNTTVNAVQNVNGVTGRDDVKRVVDAVNGTDAGTVTIGNDGVSIQMSNDSQNGNGNGSDGDATSLSLDVNDLTVDAIAQQHSDVAALQEQAAMVDDYESTLDDVASTVNVLVDAVSDVTDVSSEDDAVEQLTVLEDAVSDVASELEEYRSDERGEIVDDITSLTSKWSEDELHDVSIDELRDRRDLAEDIAADVSTGSDSSSVGTDSDSGVTVDNSSTQTQSSKSSSSNYKTFDSVGALDLSDTA